MHSFLYQILHPWHWLTYGQNAAGVGIVGLFLYTLYTREMMKLAEASRRATITPVFSLKAIRFYPTEYEPSTVANQIGLVPQKAVAFRLELDIRNIGEGPAIAFQSWYQPVSERFTIADSNVLSKSSHVRSGELKTSELLKSESATILFPGFKEEDWKHPWLFVFESTNLADGRDQLKVLIPNGPWNEIALNMSHALGNSAGERIVRVANRIRDIAGGVFKKV
jgi:hypothetical protein